MPFDQPTRNRLARFVADARSLLSEEFTRQLQHEYGMDPGSGDVAELTKLGHLDDARRETARILRATLDHYLAGAAVSTKAGAGKKARQETLERIVREQAYTVLNRLAALRMAEARGLLIESVGRGYQSRGFQLYAHLAGPALGETGAAYRSFLFSLFDELAVELPALFDRFSPQGRLFPRETSLLRLLDLLDAPDLEALWSEDETIGWIYQYFNSGEERRQMRAESQAPRNSRELAVRNQFFTPRYVVEFLTDNTLGRIWYEMTQGRTALAETCRYLVRRPNEVFLAEGESGGEGETGREGERELSQEELLRQPVYIPYRPLKDPREITMLDPACGSMHFGLYAFDLFERIYEEAWDLQAANLWPTNQPINQSTNHLFTDYPTKAALRRAIPRLIIEHNIHGIDIDPRAVQIAGLSLWLRAQRSWQAQGVKPQDRPRIQRSHIVCAEPMPGEAALLEEFLAGLHADRLEGLIRRVLDVPATQQVRATERMADALCDLVRLVWEEMALAGEAGSLLKIEVTLANAVRAAEREWSERMPLFRVVEFGLTGEAGRVRYPRSLAGEEGADFWQQAEALVLAALHDYAEQAQNGAGYQRRLFAQDAARGFAFIDLCGKLYDVVLMNPPFGEAARVTEDYLQAHYPEWNFNLFCCFVARALEQACFVGAITDRAYMLKTSYEDYRRKWQLGSRRLSQIVDLGWGILDANVEVNLQVFHPSAPYVEIQDLTDKGDSIPVELLDACAIQQQVRWVTRTHEYFENLPNAILSFALPLWQEVARTQGQNITERFAIAYSGLKAGQVERFVRLTWEIPEGLRGTRKPWSYFQNGSPFSPYYYPTNWVISYADDWRHIRIIPSSRITGLEQYWRPGLTYGKRTDFIYCYPMPEGQVFSNEGMAVFPNQFEEVFSLMGFINSPSCQTLMNLLAGQHKAHSYFNKMWLKSPVVGEKISDLSRSIVQNLRELDSISETSLAFVSPLFSGKSSPEKRDIVATTEIGDQLVDEARTWYTYNAEEVGKYLDDANFDEPKIPDWSTLFFERPWGTELVASNILSYAIGAVCGRWNVRLSSRSWVPTDLSNPFAPLPICPPGMLQGAHGLPAAPGDVPADYPLRISWPGILVDDPGHREDIEARVRDALRVIWPDNHDAIEQEACQILGVGSLREYFATPSRFFDDHLKRYSKSRRQAPIYWPLSTRSGSYTLWLYYHRLSDQTLYWCVNDFVEPKLTECSRQRAEVQRRSGRSAREEKELERLSEFEIELREFRDELLRVAAFWRPNLNDGVQITAAPLWRLFRHRAWQRRLKETWEQLEAGDYDWAHLALSIWPARVVPKCVTDRSLAIAHDLEDVFWVEDPPGVWRNLAAPDQELVDQVERRRSPARERLRDLLGELGRGRARGLRCTDVAEELAAGRWDDLEAALLLWPQRVAEACWDDPLLAVTLQINLPTKRTKAARERWVKERVAAGCTDLAAALLAALAGRPDRFSAFWSELARGDHDHLRLALALWPARVVAKCAADVELAEGHDVRRFLWVRGGEGVWRRRMGQEREVADEVARRKGPHDIR